MKKIYLLWCILLLSIAFLPNTVLGQTKYEAESATLTGVAAATSHTGYSGSGYVDGFDNAADKITFTVNVPTAGAYPLSLRYSNSCGVCEKYQDIKINGAAAVNTQFNATVAGWNDKNYGNITLNAGNNTMGGSSIAAQQSAINTAVQQMTWAKNSLNGTGLSLVCYEGGADNYPDNSLSLTRHPAQEQLYVDYLTALAPVCTGVFNQYCFYGGPWGLKNTAGETASIAPKWRGWIDYWSTHAARLAYTTAQPAERIATPADKALRIYPNPVTSRTLTTQIYAAETTVAQIQLISSAGQKLMDLQRTLVKGTNSLQIPVSQVKNGIYVLIITKGKEQIVKKIVINK